MTLSPGILLACIIVLLIAFGTLEKRKHRRAIRRIPIRIHVNGTRGKSSVTRLIAAGLRAGGINTIAKTTGSAARMIWQDGTETPVERHGPPSVKEQIGIVIHAAEHGAEALVLECMALQPDYQRFTEHRVIRSTHGVITNVRADHLDVMGPTVVDVGWALANTIPKNAVVFTAEDRITAPLITTAKARNTTIRVVKPGPDDVEASNRFSYLEHADNVALALAVCNELGVERDVALAGMMAASPDVGALQVWKIDFFNKKLFFVNALAANDPDSTFLAWERAKLAVPKTETTIVLYNNRGDRLSRAQQFGEFLATRLKADHYVLIGQATRAVEDEAIRAGLEEHRVSNLSEASSSEVFEKVLDLTAHASLVVAVGNLGGLGGNTASYFQHRGEPIGTPISRARVSN
jgi:poly-gamma-glutamate synthase PgsB/CapB